MPTTTPFIMSQSVLKQTLKLCQKCLLIVLLAQLMSACGGGSSNSSNPPSMPPVSMPPPDSDADGVIDTQDSCAATSPGAMVDTSGCAQEQLDTDSDGANNAIDQCPATPEGETIDSVGCGLDTQNGATADDIDADGITNTSDICDATPREQLVDASGCSDSQKDNDSDNISNDIDVCDATPMGEPVDMRGCGINTESDIVSSAFVENNGLLVVELEDTNYGGDWQLETGRRSSGNAYLIFRGNDNFNLPAVDVITIDVLINTSGIYRFSWLNIIGSGDSPTEANDSWLKIESPNFYGKKISTAQGDTPLGHIVCPVGRPPSNTCQGEAPEGSSSQGWLKVYRTGGPIDQWVWRSFTSDTDPHAIFAEFDEPGRYQILISGRSFGHGIDRLVLYRSDNAANNISEQSATSLEQMQSARQ